MSYYPLYIFNYQLQACIDLVKVGKKGNLKRQLDFFLSNAINSL
jgi:hypothetical protein